MKLGKQATPMYPNSRESKQETYMPSSGVKKHRKTITTKWGPFCYGRTRSACKIWFCFAWVLQTNKSSCCHVGNVDESVPFRPRNEGSIWKIYNVAWRKLNLNLPVLLQTAVIRNAVQSLLFGTSVPLQIQSNQLKLS